MYKQNKGSTEKPKTVSYFNQFPSNFLKPYGKGDSLADEDTISRQTNPISCKWFLRPRAGMSEFAETVTENLNLLKDENLTLIKTSKFAPITENIQTMLDSLSRLNTKNKKPSTKEDVKTVMSFLYNDEQQLDQSVNKMFTVGAAMYTTAIQYMVARSLLSQPAKLAEKLVLENQNVKNSRETKMWKR